MVEIPKEVVEEELETQVDVLCKKNKQIQPNWVNCIFNPMAPQRML